MSNFIHDAADQILDALQVAFAATANPPANFEHHAGNQLLMDSGLSRDLCCEGLCVVMISDGSPVDGSSARDGLLCLQQEFVIAVMRCAPTIDSLGNLPTAAQKAASAELVTDDRVLVLKTLKDLFRDDPISANEYEPVSDDDYRNVTATTIGPTGGCVATVVSFSIPLFEDC